MKTITETTRNKLTSIAKSKLISEKKCSHIKDSEHTVPCFGYDMNTLDSSRKWIYEEELLKGTDIERARIYANKAVLYVSQKELDKKVRAIYEDLLERAKSRLESKGDYSENELSSMISSMLA